MPGLMVGASWGQACGAQAVLAGSPRGR
jgi:hypothetical protein